MYIDQLLNSNTYYNLINSTNKEYSYYNINSIEYKIFYDLSNQIKKQDVINGFNIILELSNNNNIVFEYIINNLNIDDIMKHVLILTYYICFDSKNLLKISELQKYINNYFSLPLNNNYIIFENNYFETLDKYLYNINKIQNNIIFYCMSITLFYNFSKKKSFEHFTELDTIENFAWWDDAINAAQNEANRTINEVNQAKDRLVNAAKAESDRLVNAARDVSTNAVNAAKDEAVKLANAAINEATRLANAAKDEATRLANAAKNEATNTVNAVKNEANNIKNEANKAIDAAKNLAKELEEAAKKEATKALNTVMDTTKNIIEDVKSEATNAVDNAEKLIDTVGNDITNTTKGIITEIKKTTDQVINKIEDITKTAIDGAKEGLDVVEENAKLAGDVIVKEGTGVIGIIINFFVNNFELIKNIFIGYIAYRVFFPFINLFIIYALQIIRMGTIGTTIASIKALLKPV